ncbi:MAG: aerobic-type carbon monoxide dehydrogenase, middle subunit CoxM/CutM-like protein [Enterovirga sp.]|nr:aerobic-type carbon monoxide dehydrogenase, middle subunit CoxM/CutM-like protein [Enterovirga sp.]
MKAPDFAYLRPGSLDEALALLAADADAIPLAGGQSLLASLNMRLSAPSALVDIGRLAELRGIELTEDGVVRIGALTRHVELLGSPLVAEHLPLVAAAMHHVAHAAVRNRGTIGGSLANADPAAELPACMLALGAEVVLASPSGWRSVPATRFFRGIFETDRAPGELIVEIRVRPQSPRQRWTFLELARRRGDFAMIGLAGVLDLADATPSAAEFVFFGASQPPTRARSLAAAILGQAFPPATGGWIEDAVGADLDRVDAPGLRADTKLRLAAVLARRALAQLSHPPAGLLAACGPPGRSPHAGARPA